MTETFNLAHKIIPKAEKKRDKFMKSETSGNAEVNEMT